MTTFWALNILQTTTLYPSQPSISRNLSRSSLLSDSLCSSTSRQPVTKNLLCTFFRLLCCAIFFACPGAIFSLTLLVQFFSLTLLCNFSAYPSGAIFFACPCRAIFFAYPWAEKNKPRAIQQEYELDGIVVGNGVAHYGLV